MAGCLRYTTTSYKFPQSERATPSSRPILNMKIQCTHTKVTVIGDRIHMHERASFPDLSKGLKGVIPFNSQVLSSAVPIVVCISKPPPPP